MIKSRVQAQINALTDRYIDRDEAIKLMVLCLLSAENMFLLGKPGVGKSQLCTDVIRIVQQPRFFRLTVSPSTEAHELFGQFIERDGKRIYNTENKLPEAQIAFLDEVFKTSSEIRSALLTIALEKIFDRGDQTIKVPLISIFTASNELPPTADTVSQAFSDRLIIRYEIEQITDRDSLKRFFAGEHRRRKHREIEEPFTIEEIYEIKNGSAQVAIPDYFLDILVDLEKSCRQQAVPITHRTWEKALDVLKVAAWCNGRAELNYGDLFILRHIGWVEPHFRDAFSIILFERIFGSQVELGREIEEKKIALDSQTMITRSNFGELFAYQTAFSGKDASAQFENLRNGVTTLCSNFAFLVDIYAHLLKWKERNIEIEGQIADNIFSIPLKSEVFQPEALARINADLEESIEWFNRLSEWLKANPDVYAYGGNAEMRKIAERQKIKAALPRSSREA
jgi:MoxR-like ATPase